MKDFKDEQLVALYLKKNDESALEELVRRYLPAVYGYARKYTGNTDNASDIAQETFVKVWKNIKKYDSHRSFKTWLFTIAKRTAIDWLRQKKAVPFSALENSEGENNFISNLAEDAVSIVDQLVSRESAASLELALDGISPVSADIVRMHAKDGLTFKEISGRLKEPLNTIKSRYLRGLNKLKKLLN